MGNFISARNGLSNCAWKVAPNRTVGTRYAGSRLEVGYWQWWPPVDSVALDGTDELPAVLSPHYFVGASEQRRNDGETKFFCPLEVNDQLELGRLLHRQICRFGAFEDLVDIAG